MALKESMEAKRMAEVKQLIANGADLSERNENLETPLHVAISQDFEDVAEVLIKKLPVQMLNTICGSGLTPLYLAVWKNDFKIVQLLLKHGASAIRDSFVKDLNLRTPLQVAFHFKNYKMMNLLLEYIPEVSQSEASEIRKLPVQWAIKKDYLNIVRAIIETGNVPFETKPLLLDWAMDQDHTTIVQSMLKDGHYMTSRNKHQILKVAKSPKMAEILLKHFYAKDTKVDFIIAIEYELDGVIEQFIKIDPSIITYTNVVGMTYLHEAVSERFSISQYKIIQLMIKNGFDVNARANHGITPLMGAVITKRSSIVRLLVENGAKIDGQTDDGYTALMIAAVHQFDQIPNLIKLGASVKIRNNDGFSTFENALERKEISAMKLIIFFT